MPGAYAARDWSLWGCEARLVVTEPALLHEASGLVDAHLAAIDAAASRFRDDSELRRLHPGPDGAVEVSPLLADLLRQALVAARESDGAVVPTLGAALAALGYDRDLDDVRRRPDAPGVVVRVLPGWRGISLDGQVLHLPPGTQLDLGATGKAAAADAAARLVHDRLGCGALVSLGGDLASAGPGPDAGWQVTVRDLPGDRPQQVSLAPGGAIATSSTARRTWVQGGRTVHHLLDPATGAPVDGPWRAVTVVAPTCVRANTASTATLVKGHDGLAWLRRTGLPARLVAQDGSVATTGGWPREVAA